MPVAISRPDTGTGRATVKQAASPSQLAQMYGVAPSSSRSQWSPAASPRAPKATVGQGQTSLASVTNANDVYSPTRTGGQPMVSGPPATPRSGSGADGDTRFSLASVNGVVNNPGSQNATSGLPANGTDNANWTFDGSQKAFSPRDLETIMNDPYAFQRQFMESRGMNTPGANAALGQYASRLNPLSMILGGANMTPGDQGNLESLAELYEGLMANYTTPGGRMPDIGEIMQTLAGVGNIESGGQANSLLQALLAGEDPEGQVSAIQQILGAGLAGQPGLWGRAWSNVIDQAGTNYLDSTMDSAQGPNATMLDYLRNDPFLSRVR